MKASNWSGRLTRLSIKIGRRLNLGRPASWPTVARAVGVSVVAIRNWRGGKAIPSERNALKIVEAERNIEAGVNPRQKRSPAISS